jgi:hypothetical protein
MKVNTTPSVAHAPLTRPNARPLAQRRAPMVSNTTIDLRDKISRHHGGEDSHTAIERHHERRRNIEGCNLMKDFVSHASVRWGPVAHAPHPLAPQKFRGGGVRGACPTPAYGGLATQVLAPPITEV